MGEHEAVVDWATDFDHTDDAWAADPFPIWDELRRTCPVAHSDRYGGVWLPTRHDDVRAIAYDTEHFTSRNVIVNEGRPIAPAPRGRGAADLVGPAVPPGRTAPAAAGLRPTGHRRARGVDPRVLPEPGRRPAGSARGRCRRRLRAAHPGARHRQHARPAPGGRRAVPHLRDPRHRRRVALRRAARRRLRRPLRLPQGADRRSRHHPPRRPHLLPARRRARGRPPRRQPRHRHHRAAAHRRHRHHLERDRRVDLPPGRHPRRPRAPRRRAGAAPGGHGGAAAGLRPRHHGAAGEARLRLRRPRR